jgi:hypothetical protein
MKPTHGRSKIPEVVTLLEKVQARDARLVRDAVMKHWSR